MKNRFVNRQNRRCAKMFSLIIKRYKSGGCDQEFYDKEYHKWLHLPLRTWRRRYWMKENV